MAEPALVVFTSRTLDRMAREGGSQAWTFSPLSARACRWLVCVWNARGAYAESEPDRLVHGEAFLVAPIDSIEPSPQEPERWIARFHEYAKISKRNAWNGQRLPFRYVELGELGIDLTTLHFVPVPHEHSSRKPGQPQHQAMPLSIEEAKLGLAARFNVAPENVEIVIRG